MYVILCGLFVNNASWCSALYKRPLARSKSEVWLERLEAPNYITCPRPFAAKLPSINTSPQKHSTPSTATMSTHLPMRIASRPLHRQCLFQSTLRPFSTSPAHQKQKRKADPVQARAQAKHQESKAPSTLLAEAYENADAQLDDIGLLPKTFIRGWGSAPSIMPERVASWQAWKERLGRRGTYEWTYLRTRFSDYLTYVRLFGSLMLRGLGTDFLG